MTRPLASPLPAALLVLLAAAAGHGRPLQAPARTDTSFPARVEIVKVDVVVVDRQGNPIEGLTQADFRVEEDGKPQAIESFEAIQVPPAATEASGPTAPPPPVSTNQQPNEAAGRTFVVIFDDLNLTLLRTPAARAATADFLEKGTRAGDRVLLAATGGGAWWSTQMPSGRAALVAQLQRLEGRRRVNSEPDFMTDSEALKIHVFRDREVAARVQRRYKEYGVTPASDVQREEYRFSFEDPYLLQRASHVYLQAMERNKATLGLLERALGSLAPLPGRKAAILVSEGFINDPTLPEVKEVVEASRRANVALYFVDARGLGGLSLAETAEFGPRLLPGDVNAMAFDFPLAAEGAEVLAADTGGFTVKNTNDLAQGIARIARESETYYMLGYRPPPSPRDGRFRKIEVKVGRGGASVRARRGYYALEPAAGEAATAAGAPDFQPALDAPFPLADIPLRMTALVMGERELGKADVLVATEVDLGQFAFEKRGSELRDELQVLLVVAHRDTGEFSRYDQSIELTFPAQALERLKQSGYVVARPFPLATGAYQAKIAVRDRNGGRIGTVTHEFEVPELRRLRTSSPLLTDAVQGGAGERPRPVLVLKRRFSPESTLYCEYEIYEAARDDKTGMPRVAAGYEIRRADGGVVSRLDPTLIRPSSLGTLSRLVAAPLWRVPPGHYELVLLVEDQLAGQRLEVREPFEVAAGS